jgi:hypothetical protein
MGKKKKKLCCSVVPLHQRNEEKEQPLNKEEEGRFRNQTVKIGCGGERV